MEKNYRKTINLVKIGKFEDNFFLKLTLLTQNRRNHDIKIFALIKKGIFNGFKNRTFNRRLYRRSCN